MEAIGKGPLKLNREAPTAEAQDKKLREVGELYEKQFLRQMVKAMRSTVTESEFIKPSQGEKIFKEQLDQEYVEKWGEKGGIGLADMIHAQLLDRYGVQLGITKPAQLPHGPMKLSKKDFVSVENVPGAESRAALYKLTSEKGEPATISSPWAGKYLGDYNLTDDPSLHHLHIQHDNGLTSTLSYKGTTLQLPKNSVLTAGQTLGQTTPENPQTLWQIRPL